jgi:hypothetical protein
MNTISGFQVDQPVGVLHSNPTGLRTPVATPEPAALWAQSMARQAGVGPLPSETQIATSGLRGNILDWHGAPLLDPPALNLTPQALLFCMEHVLDKTRRMQMKDACDGMRLVKAGAERNAEARLKARAEWIDKVVEAQSRGTVSKILDWAKSVAGVIASGVALVVVATASSALLAAGPAGACLAGAAVALATYVFLQSVAGLANQIARAAGRPDFDLMKVLGGVVQDVLRFVGFPAESAREIGAIFAGGVPAVLSRLLGVDESVAKLIWEGVVLVACMTAMIGLVFVTGGAAAITVPMIIAQVISGLTMVGGGVASGILAMAERSVGQSGARLALLETRSRLTAEQLRHAQDYMERVLESSVQGTRMVMEMIEQFRRICADVVDQGGGRQAV